MREAGSHPTKGPDPTFHARAEARRRLSWDRKLNSLEWAYSPSTGAVGERWEDGNPFRICNVNYPMYGRADEVTDWVSVGKGIGQ